MAALSPTSATASPPGTSIFQPTSSSVCSLGKTDKAFRHLIVNQRDEQGNLKMYFLKGAPPSSPKTPDLPFVEEVATGALFWGESEETVRGKCAWVVVGLPAFTCLLVSYRLLRSSLLLGALVLDSLKYLSEGIKSCQYALTSEKLWGKVSLMPGVAGDMVWEVVRAPFFALATGLAAFYGFFDPYQGRAYEAAVEYAWQHEISYKHDVRCIYDSQEKGYEGFLKVFFKDLGAPRSCYLAFCFQARGSLPHPRIQVMREVAAL